MIESITSLTSVSREYIISAIMKTKYSNIATLVFVIFIFLLTSCTSLYNTGRSGKRSYSEALDGIRVACVGDSITYGYGISDWSENNYPALLQELLGDGYIVNNYGVSGASVQTDSNKPYVNRKEYRDSLEFQPEIVIFMMGSNDSKPFNWKGSKAFRNDYIALLDSYGDSEFILCTIAKAYFKDNKAKSETSFRIQPEIVDEIADIIREVAKEKGLPLIDIHEMTSSHPEWYISDSVHLNRDGAAAVAAAVREKLQALN